MMIVNKLKILRIYLKYKQAIFIIISKNKKFNFNTKKGCHWKSFKHILVLLIKLKICGCN